MAYSRSIYLSTAPAAPYDQFVEKECQPRWGAPISPLKGDFYFVYGVDEVVDPIVKCSISGSIWELQTLGRSEDAKTIEYRLGQCRKSEPCFSVKGLRIEKSSGHSELFNVFDNGEWLLVSQGMTCTVKN